MDAEKVSGLVKLLAHQSLDKFNVTGSTEPSLVAIVENPGELPALLHLNLVTMGNEEATTEDVFKLISFLLREEQLPMRMHPKATDDSEVVAVFFSAVLKTQLGKNLITTAIPGAKRVAHGEDGICMLIFPKEGMPMYSMTGIDPLTKRASMEFDFVPNREGRFVLDGPTDPRCLH